MSNKAVINTDQAPAAIGPYAQAIKAGTTVYLSGQIPLDPATMELVGGGMDAQVRRVFDNLSAVCDAAGGALHDIVIVDTAGRLAIDAELMDELRRVRDAVQPENVLLVVDAMIGQDAVTTAEQFGEQVGFDGAVLTKLDGDARGHRFVPTVAEAITVPRSPCRATPSTPAQPCGAHRICP